MDHTMKTQEEIEGREDEEEEVDRLIIIETEDDDGPKSVVKQDEDTIPWEESDKDNDAKDSNGESTDQTVEEGETLNTSSGDKKIEKWVINKENTNTILLSPVESVVESGASNIEKPASSMQMENWLRSYRINKSAKNTDSLPPPVNRKNSLEKHVTGKEALVLNVSEEEPLVLKSDVNLDIACPDRHPSDNIIMPKIEKLSPPPSLPAYKKTEAFTNVYQTSGIHVPKGMKKIENWMNNKKTVSTTEADDEKLYFLAVPRDFEVKLDKELAEKNIEFLKQSPAIKITDKTESEQRLEHFHFNHQVSNPLPITAPTISNSEIIRKNKIRSTNQVLLTPKTPQQILQNQASVVPESAAVVSKSLSNRYNLNLQLSPETLVVTSRNNYNTNIQVSPEPLIVTSRNSFNTNLQRTPETIIVTSRSGFTPSLQLTPEPQIVASGRGFTPSLQLVSSPLRIATSINYNPHIQPTPEPSTVISPNIYNSQLHRTPEPLIVTTSNSYSQHSQFTQEPAKVSSNNNFNVTHETASEPVTIPSENVNKSDPLQMEERLVARKFTQHRMDHCGTPILLLNFYSKFTLLIPEKEEFLEEQEATVEVKTQHLGDKKKLTFIRFIFDSTNAEREITAPVLHAEHLETGMELIRNQTPCVFLGQPFQNVEDVPEPLESNNLKNSPNDASFSKNNNLNSSKRTHAESCSPGQLLISPSRSSVYSSPMEAYQALHGDQPKVPTSPLNMSSTSPREGNSKKFEESKISTPKTLKRIESWMNKSPSAMAASSRVANPTQPADKIDKSNSSIKQLLLNHKSRSSMPAAGSTSELSPLELPTIIPHQVSQNVNDIQLKSPPFMTNPCIQTSQLPISGDIIMGTHGGQSVSLPRDFKLKRNMDYVLIPGKQGSYVGSEVQNRVNIQPSNPREPAQNDLDLDEPPQKMCRFDPKEGGSYKASGPPEPELIPTILAPYSSPPSHESQNYEASPEQNEYALKLAELEKRLNERLSVPSPKHPLADKEEVTVSDAESAEEEVDEDDEDYEESNEDESDGGEKLEEAPEIRSPVRVRPGSTRGRLKNCDKISRWLVTLLRDPNCNPSVITWIRPEEGIFKIVHSGKLAILWGKKKGNPNMDYSKLSRAMRYYYKTGELEVVNSRLTYRFGDRMTNWKPINASDPNFSASQ